MDWVVLSIGIGLVISLLFTEAFGLSVGGMIVPGYLALVLNQPATVFATLLTAIATWACVCLISQWAIIYGRRRVVLTMLIGFALAVGLRTVFVGMESQGITTVANITVVGYVIPGLIALWIDRTSLVQTLSPLLVASSLVRLVLIVVGMETRI